MDISPNPFRYKVHSLQDLLNLSDHRKMHHSRGDSICMTRNLLVLSYFTSTKLWIWAVGVMMAR